MDKLTQRDNEGQAHAKAVGYYSLIDKLAEYEDLEEQGLLLRLPCKAGSTIYKVYKMPTRCTVHDQYKDDYSCCGCEELECDSSYKWEIIKYIADIKELVCVSDKIGETVFLTKEEAEQKLKELTDETLL